MGVGILTTPIPLWTRPLLKMLKKLYKMKKIIIALQASKQLVQLYIFCFQYLTYFYNSFTVTFPVKFAIFFLDSTSLTLYNTLQCFLTKFWLHTLPLCSLLPYLHLSAVWELHSRTCGGALVTLCAHIDGLNGFPGNQGREIPWLVRGELGGAGSKSELSHSVRGGHSRPEQILSNGIYNKLETL